MNKLLRFVTVRHWLPIVTFCPFNGLPDPLYVSVEMLDIVPGLDRSHREKLRDLRDVRRRVRKAIAWKKLSMEDCARAVANELQGMGVRSVMVKLAFSRHVVLLTVTDPRGPMDAQFAPAELLG